MKEERRKGESKEVGVESKRGSDGRRRKEGGPCWKDRKKRDYKEGERIKGEVTEGRKKEDG